jgi:hypothetical protein
MDTGPRRNNTFSFFVTKEQANMMRDALDSLENDYQSRTVTDEIRARYTDLRRKVINLIDAIRRRETKEKTHAP